MRIIDIVSHATVPTEELVWREPQGGNGDFRFGSRVIVQESQAAIFAQRGQMADALGPGSHVLSTGNLPILSSIIGLGTSGNTPFTADVYYVNLRDLPQVTWGTNPPIQIDTPGRSPGFMLLMTRGVIDISIIDPKAFVVAYAAGRDSLMVDDLRDRIQTMLLGTLAGILSRQQITGIQSANAMLNDLQGSSLAQLDSQFTAIGLRIKAFQAMPFQAKDLTPEDMIKYGGNVDTYRAVKSLDVAQAAAENQGLGGALTSAGVGLGVGQAIGPQLNPNQNELQQLQQQMLQQQMAQQALMQQMMQNQMGQNQQNQPPATPPHPASATPAAPQTAQDVQALLDNLDLRLANGEITMDMYNTLTAKWQARLKDLKG